HDVGVVVEIADGQVLSAIDVEVPAAQTQNDPALDTRRPHQGSAQDLAEVVEQQGPAVLGTLDDPRVDVRADGQPVGTIDAGLTKRIDATSDAVGSVGHITVQLNGL